MNVLRLPRKLKKIIKLHAPQRLIDNLSLLLHYAQGISVKITSIDKLEWVEEQIIFHRNDTEPKLEKLDDETEKWIEENGVMVRTEPIGRVVYLDPEININA